MSYFQGGEFVELLSAQGKAPAAAWKLQGKISKTFDKGIKGNAFQLDGSSETKMQLPKGLGAALGLAQRFVVLQVLVPFTRSFSVEICFSDFQKVRRRFVAASAFRETARTALHVQLSLSAADIPRDEWINLVFDLQSLSEMHFPDTGYRSMESICIGGSCRLKRIFTMKDAPAPSRGSQVVKHADVRDIPRQFLFSATQLGASGSKPLPTLYFGLESASGVDFGIHGVAATVDKRTTKGGTIKSLHRSQTAPTNARTKSAKGVRTARPASRLNQPEAATQSKTFTDEAVGPGTPVGLSTTGSKLRQPRSKLGKVITAKQAKPLQQIEPCLAAPSPSRRHAFAEEQVPEVAEDDSPRSLLPVQANGSFEKEKEEMTGSAESPTLTNVKSPARSVHSSLLSSPNDRGQQSGRKSEALRQSIMGEIQQKLASLEDDDERENQRNRELFLRHTSLHRGEWHLEQLCDDDGDGALLSDEEDDRIQLSSSWRRDLNGSRQKNSDSSPVPKQRRNRENALTEALMNSRYSADNESVFSISSLTKPKTSPAVEGSPRLFDFDSLLQDVKPLTPLLEKKSESLGAGADGTADDLELAKLLAAKRAARQPTPQPQATACGDGGDFMNQQLPSSAKSVKENDIDGVRDQTRNLTLSRDVGHGTSEREEWVIVEKDLAECEEAKNDSQDKDWHLTPPVAQEEDSDIAIEEDNALSMDLTSELSASGENICDGDGVGNLENSVRPTKRKPESDDESCKSSQHADVDDSSFDFEDLVEDAESNDSRNEDADKLHFQPTPTRANQLTQEHQEQTPELPTRLASATSPVLQSPPISANRSKKANKSSQDRSVEPSQSVDLSSSFSSRRLQRLLESTDWTAELNAQANIQRSDSPVVPPSARSTKQNSARTSASAYSTDVKRSVAKARASPPRRTSRPQTPSTSSVELVYDPLLRCYYDPIANKYYALAE